MKTQPSPVLEYSNTRSYSLDERTESPESPQEAVRAPENVSKLNDGVTWAVLSICLGAWAVIGLFLWIPRVFRAVLTFSAALVHSMLTETTAQAAGQSLRSAANFYRKGFVAAVQAIRPPVERRRNAFPKTEEQESEGIEGALLVRETVWAIVVWYVLLWVTGVIRGTALDLAVVEWASLWSAWVEAVWSVPALFRS